jgi:hypothetical protein
MGTSVRFGDEPKACQEVYRAGRVGGREEGAVSRGAMDLNPGDKSDGSDIRLQRLATRGDQPFQQGRRRDKDSGRRRLAHFRRWHERPCSSSISTIV